MRQNHLVLSVFISILSLHSSTLRSDQIRNRYTHQLILGSSGSSVSIGIPGEDLSLSEWSFLPASSGTTQICMRNEVPRVCLSYDKNRLGLAKQKDQKSQQWARIPIEGTDFVRFESINARGHFIHVEHGILEASGIQPGWWSAMWAVDKEPVSDARSVHLSYEQVEDASDFYIEVNVKESHPGTYFAAIAFDGGYFGIQELGSNRCGSKNKLNKQIIFSLWNEDNSPEDDPDASALARVVSLGNGVNTRAFGGEGSGAQTYKCFNWESNATYQFHVNARTQGRYTVYKAYFGQNNDWEFIAEAKRPADGKLLSGVYSFVEDFARTGQSEGIAPNKRSPFQTRSADFMNPWQKKQGQLKYVDKAKFTAWSIDQPLTNITASTPSPKDAHKHDRVVFHLATGGNITQQAELNSHLAATVSPVASPTLPTSATKNRLPNAATSKHRGQYRNKQHKDNRP